jgi:hypothetical protein
MEDDGSHVIEPALSPANRRTGIRVRRGRGRWRRR